MAKTPPPTMKTRLKTKRKQGQRGGEILTASSGWRPHELIRKVEYHIPTYPVTDVQYPSASCSHPQNLTTAMQPPTPTTTRTPTPTGIPTTTKNPTTRTNPNDVNEPNDANPNDTNSNDANPSDNEKPVPTTRTQTRPAAPTTKRQRP